MIVKCAECKTKSCREGKDCFGSAQTDKPVYQDVDTRKIHRAAAAIEARHYNKVTRIEEILLLARELKVEKIGIAFCVGLESEAEMLSEYYSKDFEVLSVCCKVGGILKKDMQLEHVEKDREEIMCNPAGQAGLLNKAGSQLNIVCGLCSGHDAIFCKYSQAPVITLIAKDRILAHNPVGAVYNRYVHKRLNFVKK